MSIPMSAGIPAMPMLHHRPAEIPQGLSHVRPYRRPEEFLPQVQEVIEERQRHDSPEEGDVGQQSGHDIEGPSLPSGLFG